MTLVSCVSFSSGSPVVMTEFYVLSAFVVGIATEVWRAPCRAMLLDFEDWLESRAAAVRAAT